MKKLIISSVCSIALAGVAFGQGNIRWDTIPFNAMTAVTNAISYSPLFGGGASGVAGATQGATSTAATGFYYELLYTGGFNGSSIAQPSSLSSLATWSDAGATANNATASAGRLINVNPNPGLTVPWSPGTTNYVMLVGWSANLGTTWASALSTLQSSSALASVVGNAFFGMSTTGYLTTLSTSTSPGTAVFGTAASAQGLPINSLNTPLYLVPTTPVPEPSTLVLAGLGGLSLLAFRRKK